MIELPEAVVISKQIYETLKGKRIKQGNRGNSPHKFSFASGDDAYYRENLAGRTIERSWAHGGAIMIHLDSGKNQIVGGGGERIAYHESEATLPPKRQLELEFEDGTWFTVSIQGWGLTCLVDDEGIKDFPWLISDRPLVVEDGFTEEYFLSLFRSLPDGDKRAIKYFMISQPGVFGIGNGCLQEILFEAGIHAKRLAGEMSIDEQKTLYTATKQIIGDMIEAGGRDCELDLFGRAGGYVRLLHAKKVGWPCPKCGTPIEKTVFLGGACYFCPQCQQL